MAEENINIDYIIPKSRKVETTEQNEVSSDSDEDINIPRVPNAETPSVYVPTDTVEQSKKINLNEWVVSFMAIGLSMLALCRKSIKCYLSAICLLVVGVLIGAAILLYTKKNHLVKDMRYEWGFYMGCASASFACLFTILGAVVADEGMYCVWYCASMLYRYFYSS